MPQRRCTRLEKNNLVEYAEQCSHSPPNVDNEELRQFQEENPEFIILESTRIDYLEKWLMYLRQGEKYYCWWWHCEMGIVLITQGSNVRCSIQYDLEKKKWLPESNGINHRT